MTARAQRCSAVGPLSFDPALPPRRPARPVARNRARSGARLWQRVTGDMSQAASTGRAGHVQRVTSSCTEHTRRPRRWAESLGPHRLPPS